jgi:Zn-dependent protease with chaperone function
MDRAEPAQTMPCPSCQATLPVHPGYSTWCESCNWNIKPARSLQPGDDGILAREYAKIGKHQTEALFKSLAARPETMARHSPATTLAMACALLIHSLTFALAALGLALIILPWPHLLAIAFGLFLIAFAWTLRPRIAPFPKRTLPRHKYSATYALADTLADCLGARRIKAIVVDDTFNAALGHAGWRRSPMLYLGLPLWAILDEQERLALIAHELAHEAHGDVGRGFFITSALEWYGALTPPIVPSGGEFALGAIIAVPLMKVLRLLTRAGIFVLVHLLRRDSQRAEYLADRLAANVAGTKATLGLLDKLQLSHSFELSLQRVAHGHDNESLFDALRRRVREIPARELERLRRVQRLTDARLDTTHPPTPYRIDLLKHQPEAAPINSTDLALAHEASGELATLEAPLARKMIADYLA